MAIPHDVLRTREKSSIGQDKVSRLAGPVVGPARARLACLASGAGVQPPVGAHARKPTRTACPVCSVAAPDESSVVDARKVTRKDLHLAHASAGNPLATLLTLTFSVDPCTCSAATICSALGAGYLLQLHVLRPAHGGPEVRVQPLSVEHCAALVAAQGEHEVIELLR